MGSPSTIQTVPEVRRRRKRKLKKDVGAGEDSAAPANRARRRRKKAVRPGGPSMTGDGGKTTAEKNQHGAHAERHAGDPKPARNTQGGVSAGPFTLPGGASAAGTGGDSAGRVKNGGPAGAGAEAQTAASRAADGPKCAGADGAASALPPHHGECLSAPRTAEDDGKDYSKDDGAGSEFLGLAANAAFTLDRAILGPQVSFVHSTMTWIAVEFRKMLSWQRNITGRYSLPPPPPPPPVMLGLGWSSLFLCVVTAAASYSILRCLRTNPKVVEKLEKLKKMRQEQRRRRQLVTKAPNYGQLVAKTKAKMERLGSKSANRFRSLRQRAMAAIAKHPNASPADVDDSSMHGPSAAAEDGQQVDKHRPDMPPKNRGVSPDSGMMTSFSDNDAEFDETISELTALASGETALRSPACPADLPPNSAASMVDESSSMALDSGTMSPDDDAGLEDSEHAMMYDPKAEKKAKLPKVTISGATPTAGDHFVNKAATLLPGEFKLFASQESREAAEARRVAFTTDPKLIERLASQKKTVYVDHKYEIFMDTGDDQHAGTTGKVTIQLLGDKGSSRVYQLGNGSKSDVGILCSNNHRKKPFARSQTDVFILTNKHLGQVTQIKITASKSRKEFLHPGWLCDEVRVQSSRGDYYHFHCKQWFNSKKHDSIKEMSFYAHARGMMAT